MAVTFGPGFFLFVFFFSYQKPNSESSCGFGGCKIREKRRSMLQRRSTARGCAVGNRYFEYGAPNSPACGV